MRFLVIDRNAAPPPPHLADAYLREDYWDDWAKYRTMFQLFVYGADGKANDVGSLKMGYAGLRPGRSADSGMRAPAPPSAFETLPNGYFSLGQSETYYEALNLLPPPIRVLVLEALKDCAYNLAIFEAAIEEDVMKQSLLRSVHPTNVRNRYHRLAHGNIAKTSFEFNYLFPPEPNGGVPPLLNFSVSLDSIPPSNVHVLIGRNGVGKTRCMRGIAKSLTRSRVGPPIANEGYVEQIGHNRADWSFAGLISVAFSAFDDIDIPHEVTSSIKFHAIGLLSKDVNSGQTISKTPDQLQNDFVGSLANCKSGLKAERLKEAITTLANDPLFEEARVESLLGDDDGAWDTAARNLYSKLSSGHKIVLLTITRLVDLVDERTLVLLDEPEGHLHPPLLSAFIRSLADLMSKRNGVAIIATHSPVVLQEVPRWCVWLIRRFGSTVVAERPVIETFAENVGVLTREVFGLEVTSSGFHRMIRDAIANSQLTYEEVLSQFGNQLGAEGRAIARALINERGRAV
jgi:predicted ATPase